MCYALAVLEWSVPRHRTKVKCVCTPSPHISWSIFFPFISMSRLSGVLLLSFARQDPVSRPSCRPQVTHSLLFDDCLSEPIRGCPIVKIAVRSLFGSVLCIRIKGRSVWLSIGHSGEGGWLLRVYIAPCLSSQVAKSGWLCVMFVFVSRHRVSLRRCAYPSC